MKTNALLLILLLTTASTIEIHAQSSEFRTQRAQLAMFNIGFNGLIGGVGSLINSKKDKTNFRTFVKGFYKGAIGGGISHVGLSLTHQIERQRNIALAWPARIVNAFGSSIIQNAAENRRMLERLHFNLFISRFDYLPYEKKFSVRLFTSSIYGLIVVGRGARFDLGKTLQSGIFYFESDNGFSTSLGGGLATGQVSSIGMGKGLQGERFYTVFAEEVAHIVQYDRKVGGNAFFATADNRWKASSSSYQDLSKFIYFDLNGPLFWLGYRLEGTTHNCNFFEQEAINYSNRREYLCK
ncbi:MAG: hypothetical protein AAFZ63_08725 [Bacteroidota bacterium]